MLERLLGFFSVRGVLSFDFAAISFLIPSVFRERIAVVWWCRLFFVFSNLL